MIGSAMSLRRFGLAKKPLIAVPKHLLEQIAREAQQAFPTGKFLIASEEDLKKENRRLFAARCATGDYDLIVMTHQAFTSCPWTRHSRLDGLKIRRASCAATCRISTSIRCDPRVPKR